jgi:hypothetical protein
MKLLAVFFKVEDRNYIVCARACVRVYVCVCVCVCVCVYLGVRVHV